MPFRPDPDPLSPHRVTEEDRARWREWARERAQDSFRRGRIAAERGEPGLALRWLERAHRLAPEAATVSFPLAMARMSCGDPHGAIGLLLPLVQQHDFRDGWVALAAARRAAGSHDEAASAIGEALSRNAPDEAVRALLGQVARAAGWPGWCGLSGDGTLHLDRPPAPGSSRSGRDALSVRLDGVPVRLRARNNRIVLDGAWSQGRRLEVCRGGRPLLGSPIDVRAVGRIEGFVEVQDGRLHGWVWHPGEPERIPSLFLVPASGPPLVASMERFADTVSPDVPLARPRLLRFAEATATQLDGTVEVRGGNGQALMGSPLDPGLELRAGAAAALLQARFSRRGRDGTDRHAADQAPVLIQELPPFLPVSAWTVGRSPRVGPSRPASVVVPVYRHLRRTLDCLDSVLASVPADTEVVAVEDASPDQALVEALEAMAGARRIRLVRRARNGGFPASANDGIAACPDRDVVLLNSDTLVAPGWLEALRRAAYHAPEVGTATPLSNDASILSYPDHRARNKAPDLSGTKRLMALALGANGDAVHDIPTGNGFCLYLRRDCLDQVGLLREDLFAQGYGEENDWCLRARHLGWRHVAALGVFVSHVGNVSFGAARTELMRRNLQILNRLHPGYDEMVLAHIDADPLAAARRRLDLARWVQARRARANRDMAPRAVLLLTHAQGGGVERVVMERARLLRAQGIRPIVLRPDPDGVALSDAACEDPFPNLRYALPSELDALVALLGAEGVLHAEWHHLLGHHPQVRALCARLGIPFDAYVHDYAWFCQRIALVGPGGRYCGEPDVAGCDACIAVQGSNLLEDISMPALLARSAAELKAARRVVAPSQDAANRMARHFPRLRAEVVPWEDDRPDLSLERLAAVSSLAPRPGGASGRPAAAAGQPRMARIVVIGGIGREKGFEVLQACLADARARQLPIEFVVVGHTPDDMALMDAGCAFVTGEYREEEAVALIRAQDADLALLPSVWPETWCFTLGLAWRAGLPVAAFDLGAPAERLRRTGRGALLPLGLPIPELNLLLLRLCQRHSAVIPPPSAATQPIAARPLPSHHRTPAR